VTWIRFDRAGKAVAGAGATSITAAWVLAPALSKTPGSPSLARSSLHLRMSDVCAFQTSAVTGG